MGTRKISRQVLEIKRYKRESIKYPDETLKRLERSSLILIYELTEAVLRLEDGCEGGARWRGCSK